LFYVLQQKKDHNKFGLYRKSLYFCTRFKREARYNLPFVHFTIYHLKWQKNKNKLILKMFGNSEKSTTFAAALREKPTAYLPFANCPFTI